MRVCKDKCSQGVLVHAPLLDVAPDELLPQLLQRHLVDLRTKKENNIYSYKENPKTEIDIAFATTLRHSSMSMSLGIAVCRLAGAPQEYEASSTDLSGDIFVSKRRVFGA